MEEKWTCLDRQMVFLFALLYFSPKPKFSANCLFQNRPQSGLLWSITCSRVIFKPILTFWVSKNRTNLRKVFNVSLNID